MTTISERLREMAAWFERFGGRTTTEYESTCTEAADTIDALVAALELCRGEIPTSKRGDVIAAKADAALALARKGG